jgi:hypothetical protein
MPLVWGPSDEELTDAQSYQFSASMDGPRSVDQLGGKDDDEIDNSDEFEVEDDEGTDDHFGHLFELVEVANLADVYHSDGGIVSLLEDVMLHEGSNQTIPSSSPRKRSRLDTAPIF